jgi:hypothetical protein
LADAAAAPAALDSSYFARPTCALACVDGAAALEGAAAAGGAAALDVAGALAGSPSTRGAGSPWHAAAPSSTSAAPTMPAGRRARCRTDLRGEAGHEPVSNRRVMIGSLMREAAGGQVFCLHGAGPTPSYWGEKPEVRAECEEPIWPARIGARGTMGLVLISRRWRTLPSSRPRRCAARRAIGTGCRGIRRKMPHPPPAAARTPPAH